MSTCTRTGPSPSSWTSRPRVLLSEPPWYSGCSASPGSDYSRRRGTEGGEPRGGNSRSPTRPQPGTAPAGGNGAVPASGGRARRAVRVRELLGFGRACECGGRGGGVDCLADLVEIPGADLALVPGGGVAGGLGRELRVLQFHVGGHAALGVAAGQGEHRLVEP